MTPRVILGVLLVFLYANFQLGYGAPSMKPMDDFDISKYLGRWWLYKRANPISGDLSSSKCYAIDATPVKPGKYDELDLVIHSHGPDGKLIRKDLFVEDDEEHPAQMFITGTHHDKLAFRVIATDYKTWSLTNLGADGKEYVGVSTRSTDLLDDESVAAIKKVLEANGMSWDKLTNSIDNSDCADIPDHVEAKI